MLQPTDVYCPSSPACPSPWCHSRLDRGSRLPIVAGNDATMALRAGDLWSLGHFAKVLHNDRPPTTLQGSLVCTRGRNQGVVYSDGLSTALQRVSPCSCLAENAKTAWDYPGKPQSFTERSFLPSGLKISMEMDLGETLTSARSQLEFTRTGNLASDTPTFSKA